MAEVVAPAAGYASSLWNAYAGATEPGAGPMDIPDPIGGPDDEYEETFRVLDELIGRVLERLEPVLAP